MPFPAGGVLLGTFLDLGPCDEARRRECPFVPPHQPTGGPPTPGEGNWDHARQCWVGQPPACYPFTELGLPDPGYCVPLNLQHSPGSITEELVAYYGVPGDSQLPLRLCGPSGPPHPIGGTNGTPFPPPPPPPGQCSWYCVDFSRCADGSDTRCLYSTPESINQACLKLVSGPFEQEIDCVHACQRCKDQCRTQPPPPPPPPPIENTLPATTLAIPAMPDCGLLSSGALPRVGSPEWCACLLNFRAWFATVGQQAVDFLLPLSVTGEQLGFFAQLTSAISPAGIAASVVTEILQPLLPLIANRINQGLDIIRGIMAGAQVCNPVEMIGLELCRTLLRLLNQVRLGTDALVWATLDAKLSVSVLERILDYAVNHACPVEVPAVGESIECMLQQTTAAGQAECWMQMRGSDPVVWEPVIDARRDKLHDGELIEWGRRNGQDDSQIAFNLQAQGWFRIQEAQARVALYDELPTISDHLHWLQRNVFNDEYVADFQLMEGFEDRFWTKFGPDLRAKGYTKYRAALDYAAHWINPAPEQLKEMVYRLDPDFTDPALAFSLDSYQRVLQEQDVSAYFRPRFAAIAYKIPALGYIRDMFNQSVIDSDQLKVYHRSLGYNAADSDNFVGVDQIRKARLRASQSHGWTPGTMAKAYAVGQLTAGEMDALYDKLGWTQDEAIAARQVALAELQHAIYVRARSRAMQAIVSNTTNAMTTGLITVDTATSMLEDAGYPHDFAEAVARGEWVNAQVARVRGAIQRLRRAFDSGEIAAEFAANSLSQLGITPDAIASYLSTWAIELTPGRKRRSAQQITNDVADAAMTWDEALVRLTNLGYDDADRLLYLADVRRKVVANEAKALAADARIVAQRSRQLAESAKESRRHASDIVAQLRREEPESKLQQWAALGLITYTYFVDRLTLYGFDQTSIDLWWEQACAKKNAHCVNGPAVASGTESSGVSPIADGGQLASAAGAVSSVGLGQPAVPQEPLR